MVGDMDTDIIGGVQAGLGTILVLTGVTKREDAVSPSAVADRRSGG